MTAAPTLEAPKVTSLGGRTGGRVRLGRTGCLLLATTPWLAPWYAVWALPLAAADEDDAARVLGVALTVYLLPQTVPI